jgi:hypothetical protein
VQQAEIRAWNPGVAAVLSLLIPGAGQMYKGNVLGGVVWLIAVIIGYTLLVPGVILHLCCIASAASGTPPTVILQGAARPAPPPISVPSSVGLAPRGSNRAEIRIGRGLAILAHPRIAWPMLSLGGKIGVVVGYAIIAALIMAGVRSGR